MQVSQFLTEHQVHFESIVHPPAFSASKRAKILHVPGRQVAKTILLAGPEDYLLAVLPATLQVDTKWLSTALGGPVRLAEPREVTELFHDCEWGVVPPFGPMYGLPTILEDSIDPEATLVWEGHTHDEAIRLACRDFERLVRPIRLRFARP